MTSRQNHTVKVLENVQQIADIFKENSFKLKLNNLTRKESLAFNGIYTD